MNIIRREIVCIINLGVVRAMTQGYDVIILPQITSRVFWFVDAVNKLTCGRDAGLEKVFVHAVPFPGYNPFGLGL